MQRLTWYFIGVYIIKIDIINDKTYRGQSIGCDCYQIIAKIGYIDSLSTYIKLQMSDF